LYLQFAGSMVANQLIPDAVERLLPGLDLGAIARAQAEKLTDGDRVHVEQVATRVASQVWARAHRRRLSTPTKWQSEPDYPQILQFWADPGRERVTAVTPASTKSSLGAVHIQCDDEEFVLTVTRSRKTPYKLAVTPKGGRRAKKPATAALADLSDFVSIIHGHTRTADSAAAANDSATEVSSRSNDHIPQDPQAALTGAGSENSGEPEAASEASVPQPFPARGLAALPLPKHTPAQVRDPANAAWPLLPPPEQALKLAALARARGWEAYVDIRGYGRRQRPPHWWVTLMARTAQGMRNIDLQFDLQPDGTYVYNPQRSRAVDYVFQPPRGIYGWQLIRPGQLMHARPPVEPAQGSSAVRGPGLDEVAREVWNSGRVRLYSSSAAPDPVAQQQPHAVTAAQLAALVDVLSAQSLRYLHFNPSPRDDSSEPIPQQVQRLVHGALQELIDAVPDPVPGETTASVTEVAQALFGDHAAIRDLTAALIAKLAGEVAITDRDRSLVAAITGCPPAALWRSVELGLDLAAERVVEVEHAGSNAVYRIEAGDMAFITTLSRSQGLHTVWVADDHHRGWRSSGYVDQFLGAPSSTAEIMPLVHTHLQRRAERAAITAEIARERELEAVREQPHTERGALQLWQEPQPEQSADPAAPAPGASSDPTSREPTQQAAASANSVADDPQDLSATGHDTTATETGDSEHSFAVLRAPLPSYQSLWERAFAPPPPTVPTGLQTAASYVETLHPRGWWIEGETPDYHYNQYRLHLRGQTKPEPTELELVWNREDGKWVFDTLSSRGRVGDRDIEVTGPQIAAALRQPITPPPKGCDRVLDLLVSRAATDTIGAAWIDTRANYRRGATVRALEVMTDLLHQLRQPSTDAEVRGAADVLAAHPLLLRRLAAAVADEGMRQQDQGWRRHRPPVAAVADARTRKRGRTSWPVPGVPHIGLSEVERAVIRWRLTGTDISERFPHDDRDGHIRRFARAELGDLLDKYGLRRVHTAVAEALDADPQALTRSESERRAVMDAWADSAFRDRVQARAHSHRGEHDAALAVLRRAQLTEPVWNPYGEPGYNDLVAQIRAARPADRQTVDAYSVSVPPHPFVDDNALRQWREWATSVMAADPIVTVRNFRDPNTPSRRACRGRVLDEITDRLIAQLPVQQPELLVDTDADATREWLAADIHHNLHPAVASSKKHPDWCEHSLGWQLLGVEDKLLVAWHHDSWVVWSGGWPEADDWGADYRAAQAEVLTRAGRADLITAEAGKVHARIDAVRNAVIEWAQPRIRSHEIVHAISRSADDWLFERAPRSSLIGEALHEILAELPATAELAAAVSATGIDTQRILILHAIPQVLQELRDTYRGRDPRQLADTPGSDLHPDGSDIIVSGPDGHQIKLRQRWRLEPGARGWVWVDAGAAAEAPILGETLSDALTAARRQLTADSTTSALGSGHHEAIASGFSAGDSQVSTAEQTPTTPAAPQLSNEQRLLLYAIGDWYVAGAASSDDFERWVRQVVESRVTGQLRNRATRDRPDWQNLWFRIDEDAARLWTAAGALPASATAATVPHSVLARFVASLGAEVREQLSPQKKLNVDERDHVLRVALGIEQLPTAGAQPASAATTAASTDPVGGGRSDELAADARETEHSVAEEAAQPSAAVLTDDQRLLLAAVAASTSGAGRLAAVLVDPAAAEGLWQPALLVSMPQFVRARRPEWTGCSVRSIGEQLQLSRFREPLPPTIAPVTLTREQLQAWAVSVTVPDPMPTRLDEIETLVSSLLGVDSIAASAPTEALTTDPSVTVTESAQVAAPGVLADSEASEPVVTDATSATAPADAQPASAAPVQVVDDGGPAITDVEPAVPGPAETTPAELSDDQRLLIYALAATVPGASRLRSILGDPSEVQGLLDSEISSSIPESVLAWRPQWESCALRVVDDRIVLTRWAGRPLPDGIAPVAVGAEQLRILAMATTPLDSMPDSVSELLDAVGAALGIDRVRAAVADGPIYPALWEALARELRANAHRANADSLPVAEQQTREIAYWAAVGDRITRELPLVAEPTQEHALRQELRTAQAARDAWARSASLREAADNALSTVRRRLGEATNKELATIVDTAAAAARHGSDPIAELRNALNMLALPNVDIDAVAEAVATATAVTVDAKNPADSPSSDTDASALEDEDPPTWEIPAWSPIAAAARAYDWEVQQLEKQSATGDIEHLLRVGQASAAGVRQFEMPWRVPSDWRRPVYVAAHARRRHLDDYELTTAALLPAVVLQQIRTPALPAAEASADITTVKELAAAQDAAHDTAVLARGLAPASLLGADVTEIAWWEAAVRLIDAEAASIGPSDIDREQRVSQLQRHRERADTEIQRLQLLGDIRKMLTPRIRDWRIAFGTLTDHQIDALLTAVHEIGYATTQSGGDYRPQWQRLEQLLATDHLTDSEKQRLRDFATELIPAHLPRPDGSYPDAHTERVVGWLASAGIAHEFDTAEDTASQLAYALGETVADELISSPGWSGLHAVLIAAENRGFDLNTVLRGPYQPGMTAEDLRLQLRSVLIGADGAFPGVPERLLLPGPVPQPPRWPTPEPDLGFDRAAADQLVQILVAARDREDTDAQLNQLAATANPDLYRTFAASLAADETINLLDIITGDAIDYERSQRILAANALSGDNHALDEYLYQQFAAAVWAAHAPQQAADVAESLVSVNGFFEMVSAIELDESGIGHIELRAALGQFRIDLTRDGTFTLAVISPANGMPGKRLMIAPMARITRVWDEIHDHLRTQAELEAHLEVERAGNPPRAAASWIDRAASNGWSHEQSWNSGNTFTYSLTLTRTDVTPSWEIVLSWEADGHGYRLRTEGGVICRFDGYTPTLIEQNKGLPPAAAERILLEPNLGAYPADVILIAALADAENWAATGPDTLLRDHSICRIVLGARTDRGSLHYELIWRLVDGQWWYIPQLSTASHSPIAPQLHDVRADLYEITATKPASENRDISPASAALDIAAAAREQGWQALGPSITATRDRCTLTLATDSSAGPRYYSLVWRRTDGKWSYDANSSWAAHEHNAHTRPKLNAVRGDISTLHVLDVSTVPAEPGTTVDAEPETAQPDSVEHFESAAASPAAHVDSSLITTATQDPVLVKLAGLGDPDLYQVFGAVVAEQAITAALAENEIALTGSQLWSLSQSAAQHVGQASSAAKSDLAAERFNAAFEWFEHDILDADDESLARYELAVTVAGRTYSILVPEQPSDGYEVIYHPTREEEQAGAAEWDVIGTTATAAQIMPMIRNFGYEAAEEYAAWIAPRLWPAQAELAAETAPAHGWNVATSTEKKPTRKRGTKPQPPEPPHLQLRFTRTRDTAPSADEVTLWWDFTTPYGPFEYNESRSTSSPGLLTGPGVPLAAALTVLGGDTVEHPQPASQGLLDVPLVGTSDPAPAGAGAEIEVSGAASRIGPGAPVSAETDASVPLVVDEFATLATAHQGRLVIEQGAAVILRDTGAACAQVGEATIDWCVGEGLLEVVGAAYTLTREGRRWVQQQERMLSQAPNVGDQVMVLTSGRVGVVAGYRYDPDGGYTACEVILDHTSPTPSSITVRLRYMTILAPATVTEDTAASLRAVATPTEVELVRLLPDPAYRGATLSPKDSEDSQFENSDEPEGLFDIDVAPRRDQQTKKQNRKGKKQGPELTPAQRLLLYSFGSNPNGSWVLAAALGTYPHGAAKHIFESDHWPRIADNVLRIRPDWSACYLKVKYDDRPGRMRLARSHPRIDLPFSQLPDDYYEATVTRSELSQFAKTLDADLRDELARCNMLPGSKKPPGDRPSWERQHELLRHVLRIDDIEAALAAATEKQAATETSVEPADDAAVSPRTFPPVVLSDDQRLLMYGVYGRLLARALGARGRNYIAELGQQGWRGGLHERVLAYRPEWTGLSYEFGTGGLGWHGTELPETAAAAAVPQTTLQRFARSLDPATRARLADFDRLEDDESDQLLRRVLQIDAIAQPHTDPEHEPHSAHLDSRLATDETTVVHDTSAELSETGALAASRPGPAEAAVEGIANDTFDGEEAGERPPAERWQIPPVQHVAGNPGKGKSVLRRSLQAAIRVTDSDADRAVLEIARDALTKTSWARFGGIDGQARQLADMDDALIAEAGLTRQDVDARMQAVTDLADELDRRGYGDIQVAKANGQEPTLSSYLRDYATAYHARRRQQAPTAEAENADATQEHRSPAAGEPAAPTTASADTNPDAPTDLTAENDANDPAVSVDAASATSVQDWIATISAEIVAELHDNHPLVQLAAISRPKLYLELAGIIATNQVLPPIDPARWNLARTPAVQALAQRIRSGEPSSIELLATSVAAAAWGNRPRRPEIDFRTRAAVIEPGDWNALKFSAHPTERVASIVITQGSREHEAHITIEADDRRYQVTAYSRSSELVRVSPQLPTHEPNAPTSKHWMCSAHEIIQSIRDDLTNTNHANDNAGPAASPHAALEAPPVDTDQQPAPTPGGGSDRAAADPEGAYGAARAQEQAASRAWLAALDAGTYSCAELDALEITLREAELQACRLELALPANADRDDAKLPRIDIAELLLDSARQVAAARATLYDTIELLAPGFESQLTAEQTRLLDTAIDHAVRAPLHGSDDALLDSGIALMVARLRQVLDKLPILSAEDIEHVLQSPHLHKPARRTLPADVEEVVEAAGFAGWDVRESLAPNEARELTIRSFHADGPRDEFELHLDPDGDTYRYNPSRSGHEFGTRYDRKRHSAPSLADVHAIILQHPASAAETRSNANQPATAPVVPSAGEAAHDTSVRETAATEPAGGGAPRDWKSVVDAFQSWSPGQSPDTAVREAMQAITPDWLRAVLRHRGYELSESRGQDPAAGADFQRWSRPQAAEISIARHATTSGYVESVTLALAELTGGTEPIDNSQGRVDHRQWRAVVDDLEAAARFTDVELATIRCVAEDHAHEYMHLGATAPARELAHSALLQPLCDRHNRDLVERTLLAYLAVHDGEAVLGQDIDAITHRRNLRETRETDAAADRAQAARLVHALAFDEARELLALAQRTDPLWSNPLWSNAYARAWETLDAAASAAEDLIERAATDTQLARFAAQAPVHTYRAFAATAAAQALIDLPTPSGQSTSTGERQAALLTAVAESSFRGQQLSYLVAEKAWKTADHTRQELGDLAAPLTLNLREGVERFVGILGYFQDGTPILGIHADRHQYCLIARDTSRGSTPVEVYRQNGPDLVVLTLIGAEQPAEVMARIRQHQHALAAAEDAELEAAQQAGLPVEHSLRPGPEIYRHRREYAALKFPVRDIAAAAAACGFEVTVHTGHDATRLRLAADTPNNERSELEFVWLAETLEAACEPADITHVVTNNGTTIGNTLTLVEALRVIQSGDPAQDLLTHFSDQRAIATRQERDSDNNADFRRLDRDVFVVAAWQADTLQWCAELAADPSTDGDEHHEYRYHLANAQSQLAAAHRIATARLQVLRALHGITSADPLPRPAASLDDIIEVTLWRVERGADPSVWRERFSAGVADFDIAAPERTAALDLLDALHAERLRDIASTAQDIQLASAVAEPSAPVKRPSPPADIDPSSPTTADDVESTADSDSAVPPLQPAAAEPAIVIEHNRTGTLIHGIPRWTPLYETLRQEGFRHSKNIDKWFLPRPWTFDTRSNRVRRLGDAFTRARIAHVVQPTPPAQLNHAPAVVRSTQVADAPQPRTTEPLVPASAENDRDRLEAVHAWCNRDSVLTPVQLAHVRCAVEDHAPNYFSAGAIAEQSIPSVLADQYLPELDTYGGRDAQKQAVRDYIAAHNAEIRSRTREQVSHRRAERVAHAARLRGEVAGLLSSGALEQAKQHIDDAELLDPTWDGELGVTYARLREFVDRAAAWADLALIDAYERFEGLIAVTDSHPDPVHYLCGVRAGGRRYVLSLAKDDGKLVTLFAATNSIDDPRRMTSITAHLGLPTAPDQVMNSVRRHLSDTAHGSALEEDRWRRADAENESAPWLLTGPLIAPYERYHGETVAPDNGTGHWHRIEISGTRYLVLESATDGRYQLHLADDTGDLWHRGSAVTATNAVTEVMDLLRAHAHGVAYEQGYAERDQRARSLPPAKARQILALARANGWDIEIHRPFGAEDSGFASMTVSGYTARGYLGWYMNWDTRRRSPVYNIKHSRSYTSPGGPAGKGERLDDILRQVHYPARPAPEATPAAQETKTVTVAAHPSSETIVEPSLFDLADRTEFDTTAGHDFDAAASALPIGGQTAGAEDAAPVQDAEVAAPAGPRGTAPANVADNQDADSREGTVDGAVEQARPPRARVLDDLPADSTEAAGGSGRILPGAGQPDAGADRDTGRSDDERAARGAAADIEDAGRGTGIRAGGAAAGQGTGDRAPGDLVRFRPTGREDLGATGEMTRARANLAALRTLRQLQLTGRSAATAEEQRVLARWSGWGALSTIFAKKPPQTDSNALARWLKLDAERTEVRQLLSNKEWAAASRNTTTAFYTDPTLVNVIWDTVRALGFDGGRVGDFGCGTGNFIGFAPTDTSEPIKIDGIEVDPITAAIATYLYPDAKIINKPFEDVRVSKPKYGLVIGNIPFGETTPYDPVYNRDRELKIHNLFLWKSLHAVEPGGLVAVITSRYTLDNSDPSLRQKLHSMADLVGAVRLPTRAHRGMAGTDVVTDILFLRRRPDGEAPAADDSWLHTQQQVLPGNEQPVEVNTYFLTHPEQVVGELCTVRAQFPEPKLSVKLAASENLEELVAAAATRIAEPEPEPEFELPALDQEYLPEGALGLDDDGEPTIIEDGEPVPVEVHPQQRDRLIELIQLKTLTKQLYAAEGATSVAGDTPHLTALRDRLRESWRRYRASNPPLTKPGQKRIFTPREASARAKKQGLKKTPDEWKSRTAFSYIDDDPDAALLFGLERWDARARKGLEQKVLHGRVLEPRQMPTAADDVDSAVAIALDQDGGRLDIDRVAALLGISRMEAVAQVEAAGLGFRDPEDPSEWIPRHLYLSGNVRTKLDAARTAATENPVFQVNVDALEKVQPRDLFPSEITAKVGAPWIPAEDYTAFLRHLGFEQATVKHAGGVLWEVTGAHAGDLARTEWGTMHRSAQELFGQLLCKTESTIKITREAKGRKVVDREATDAAQEKARTLARAFEEWVWADPVRAKRLARLYNDTLNNLVGTEFDSSPLTLPGLRPPKPGWAMRAHQNAAIRRILSGQTLLAHVVGAGKTATIVAAAMELRRTGLTRKPVIVVPNHMLKQWTGDFRTLYPNAKLLAINASELGASAPKFMARIAGGDWDAVILTHEAFTRVPLRKATQERYLRRELAFLRDQLERAEEAGMESRTVKQIETVLEN
ncbi:DEAD/DEAH box helicase family protein, partial [Nocardia asiatica]|uniref:DEAD/DEAH box helicase family protein n=1 Tax=Nocardia asiatica TaxID=209252 RepID=UPI0005C1B2AD